MNSSDFGYPMNLHAYATRGIIWGQRQIFAKFLKRHSLHSPMPIDYVGQDANDAIKDLIDSGKPFLVARFGCVELDAMLRGWDIRRKGSLLRKCLGLLTGSFGPFWWDNSIKAGLLRTTGVFPADEKTLMRFSEQALEDSRQLDILGTWNARERQLAHEFFPGAKAVDLDDLDPFFFKDPWSSSLAGKKVLLIHPFVNTIRSQYARRTELFEDKSVLPEFELMTYCPATTFLGLSSPYKNWFDALYKMCDDISRIDFDAAILGCGAYGLSIGAFIKRNLHRQAIHLGGVTQLLFGIKGGRWDDRPRFNAFYNTSWVRPGESERPFNFKQHEGGAYW